MIKISSAIFKTFFLSLCIVANTHFAFAQTASILPPGYTQYLDSNGKPLSAGKVYNYIPNTTTPKTTWQDAAETIPNANPVILDAGGRAKILGDGSYRQIVKDRNNVTIWDAVTSSTGSGSSAPTATGDGDLVGTIKPWAGMTAPNQYAFTYGQEVSRTTYATLYTAITSSQSVFCNSGSPTLNGLSDTTNFWIGMSVEVSCVAAGFSTIVSKTSSTVTLAANANVTTNTTAVFYPWGRGDGTTTFNLPDLRGVVPAGNNNMGGVASANLTTTYFGATNPNSIGALGGSQSKTLIAVEVPGHSHPVFLNDPGHNHTYNMYPSGTIPVQGGGTYPALGYGSASSLTTTVPTGITVRDATGTGSTANQTSPTGGGIAVSATIGVVGSGYTPGSQTITVSGGTCTTQPQFTVTISGGGAFSGTPALLTAGSCTVAPTNPASTTGGGGTGGTLNVSYSAQPFSLIPPTRTTNFIIKITPDTNSASASGVTSLGGMTGDIACGAGVTCTGNTISINASTITIDSTHVNYTLPLTGGVQETQSAYNLQRISVKDCGAVGDGVTDDSTAFFNCYNAVPNGGTLYIPASNAPYLLNTCNSNNAIINSISTNANKAVSIIGDGWNFKTSGSYSNPRGSVLKLGAGIPNTCSFIRYAGTHIVTGITLKDFAVVASTGTFGTPVGLHGIFIDESLGGSAFYLTNFRMDHVFIDNMAAGYSIKIDAVNSGVYSGGLAFSSITNSQLMSINAAFLGDKVEISGNTFGQNCTNDTRCVAIEMSQVSGAASALIVKNVISNLNGMIILHNATKPIIRDNELEQSAGIANSYGTLIDLLGDVDAVVNPTVTGNSISQNSLIANYKPINVDNVSYATIEDNRIALGAVAPYDYITITGGAAETKFGINRCSYNTSVAEIVDTSCAVASLGPSGKQETIYTWKIPGSTSGLVTITTQAAAGTPTISWPTGTGTLASAASLPIVLNATTGNLTCPTCTTSAASLTANQLVIGAGSQGLAVITTGTGVLTALGVNVGNADAFVTFNGALGTPSSATLTNAIDLPISTGVSGLGTNVATFLATASSANLSAALTDETGTGVAVFNIAPSITGEAIFTAPSTTSTGAQFTTAVSANDYVPAARMTYGGNSGFTNLGFWMRSAGDAAFASWAKYDATDDRWEYPVTSTYGSSLQAFNDNLTGSITYYTAPSAAVTANNPITFTQRFQVSGNGDIVVGSAALATNATTGFLFIPTSAGTPTGVPTTYTGRVAIEYDTTNHKICVYDPTTPSWRCSAAM